MGAGLQRWWRASTRFEEKCAAYRQAHDLIDVFDRSTSSTANVAC